MSRGYRCRIFANFCFNLVYNVDRHDVLSDWDFLLLFEADAALTTLVLADSILSLVFLASLDDPAVRGFVKLKQKVEDVVPVQFAGRWLRLHHS